MGSSTEAEETLPTKGAQDSLWRTGTAGREFSRLVGRAWSEGLPDEHGGRCHQRNPGLSGERRDDLGGGRSVTSLDREIWGASRALYHLEERVQTESDSGGTDAGQDSGYAVWTDVPEAGHAGRRCQYAPSQGAGGA